MERSTRILRDLLPLSSSCFLEFRKCWWIEWIHELYSTTQMALWTSINSSYFWGWIEWHILTPSTPGSCALWFASSSFVFPCSPQMRCNFQTAQLGTSFAALVPRRVPGPRYWSLFRVCFFRCGACPHSQIFQSAALFWARPHQRPHLLPLLQSQPVGCYFMLFYTKTMQETNEVTDILCRYVCKYNNIYQSVCACKNRMRKSWNPGKSLKWTRPTNVGFHLQTWDQHGVVDDHCVYSKRFQSLVCFHFLEYASGRYSSPLETQACND